MYLAIFCISQVIYTRVGAGNYIATSPAPENIKVPLATVAYIAGMLGFAIKETLGGQTTASTTKA